MEISLTQYQLYVLKNQLDADRGPFENFCDENGFESADIIAAFGLGDQ